MPSSAQQQSSGNSPIPSSDGGGTFPAVVPAGHVNISGVLVRKDGLVVNPGLRALEASPNTVVGQWCPRNDDPTHAILTCTKIHKNALAAAVSTNVASHPSPIVPASPAAVSNKPNFPQQPPAAVSSSAASSPTVVDGVTIAVPPHQQQQQQQPTITTAGSSANLPTLLTETQRRAAIGAAVSSGGVGGFRRPVGGEKLRKNQIAAQILRAASDTTPLSQSVNTNTNPITTAAANVAASQLPPMAPASGGGGGGGVGTNTNSSRNNASFGNKDSVLESFASGLGGAGTDDSVTRGGSSSKTGTITKAELRGSYQLSNSRSSRGSALHNQEAGHPHQQQRGGNQFHPHYNNQPIHQNTNNNNNNNSNGGDDGTVVDPRSFQARFPHVVHMCVAHTFNLDDMMSLFKDDLDYEAEMCYDVLHIWREGAGGEGGGSAMKSELEGGDDQEWDVVNRDTSTLLGRNNNNNNNEDQNDDNNNHHHDPHTTTTTSSKRNKKGPGHHHRSHHRRSGPRLGEGNPRASAVSMRKPFNLFLFAYGSVVFWGSPEVYAEVVEPFISDSVGTGGGSGGQASNLRAGARGTSDYNAPTSRSRKAAHKIISALERAMGQRYPKDVILDRFPVRCSYEIAAFGGGGGDQYQQQPQYDNPQHGEDLQAHLESYEITSMEPPVTAGEAAAREAEMFKRSLLRNHHFIIPAVSDSIPMLCIAHALAQAAKVDVLEGMINQLMEQCHPLPTQLKDDGFVRITEKHLLQLRGEVLFYRMQLRGGSDLQAEPEPIWHFPAMETFYLITREVFEVEKLIDVLDSKLDAGNEILSVLSDQFSQRHSSRLEWIVIWLVFVEVIIGVLELILDMKPWFM